MMKQSAHVFLAAFSGQEAYAEVLEVFASKTNTYVADEYYLEIQIGQHRTGDFESARDDLKETSEKAVAAIREAGVDIVSLESSSVLPDLRSIYNYTTGKAEIQDTFTVQKRITLGSYSDLLRASAVISTLGISDEELRLSAGSRLTDEAILVEQTFMDASQQVYMKASEQAEQNHGLLGRLSMINTLRYESDSQELQDTGSNGEYLEFQNDDREEVFNSFIWFSDKIHVTATIWAIFEQQPLNTQVDVVTDQNTTAFTVKAKSSLYIPSDFITVAFKVSYYLEPALDLDIENCKADASTTTQNIIADLIQSGIASSSIYLGEDSRPLCTYVEDETTSIYVVYEEVNIDLLDISELEDVLNELAKFPQVGVTNLKPRLRQPDKNFNGVVQQAKEKAKRIANEIGGELNMSVGDVLHVKQLAEQAAFPKYKRAGFHGTLYRGDINLRNEPLKWVELQSEVEMTYSLTDR